MICANEDIIADSETLRSSVGEEGLIEDEINQQIKEQESIVSTSTNKISTYQSNINTHLSLDMGISTGSYIVCANWQISRNNDMISSANAVIQELKGKLEDIDAIESATNSLYDSAAGLYAEVNAGHLPGKTVCRNLPADEGGCGNIGGTGSIGCGIYGDVSGI